MSRTKKGSKRSTEMWSKRLPNTIAETGRYGKTRTHRYERRAGKEEAKKAPHRPEYHRHEYINEYNSSEE